MVSISCVNEWYKIYVHIRLHNMYTHYILNIFMYVYKNGTCFLANFLMFVHYERKRKDIVLYIVEISSVVDQTTDIV
jgi:hypothetical protein